MEEHRIGHGHDVVVEELDYSSDKTSDKFTGTVKVEAYDSRPHEDGARRTIAYLLLGLLWVIIGSVLIMVAYGSITVDDVKEFSVITGPVVALVSAATGFYYGTKSKDP